MEEPTQPSSYERKVDFLRAALDAAEKRRDAIEHKSEILLASSAIILGAMIAFGLPLLLGGQILSWILAVVAIVTLAATITSAILAAQILTPLSTNRRRRAIMDLPEPPESEDNLFLFLEIAKTAKAEYRSRIANLSDAEIIEQLTLQVHNLSRLLVHRDSTVRRSNAAFIIALTAFAVFALTKFFLN